MNKNEIKMVNDTISSIVCYMRGEWTESQLMGRIEELGLPKEVVEHIQTIVTFG